MQVFFDIWDTIISPDVRIAETVFRGTLMYFAVFIIMRSTLRRTAGELAMLDFIFVLLVAGGAADAMIGGSVSVANAVILILTIVAWNYAFNTLSWYIPWLERWTTPPPLPLVKDGKVLRRNMRKEFITMDELMAKLREDGIDDIARVKSALLEGDGNISVIPYKDT
jgi:uncharacterized membrane protein YcaP (DUF421 family)